MSTRLVPVTQEEKHEEIVDPVYGMLLPADRCDWCGAQAYVRVIHPTAESWVRFLNQDLLFCGHHFDRALKTGKLDDWSVLDERAKLSS